LKKNNYTKKTIKKNMDKILPIYDITIEDLNAEEELGIEQIAFVKNPAIKIKGVAFSQNLEFQDSYNDYPKAASENAKVALRWAEENGWGDCGTAVGKARANQLAKGESITRDTIARMAAFERHRQNSDKELGDGCGRLMWLAWGGDEGVEWAQRKLEQIDRVNLKDMCFKDNLKHRIAAPALIPSVIYRNDEDGEYNVRFTEDEIEKIYKKFMQSLQSKKDVFNIEHTDEIVPAYVLEAMLVDTKNKKEFIKQEYNIDIPKGSVFVVSQITDEGYYNEIVKNDQTSYSIEGFLSLVKLSENQITNKNKEEMKEKELLAKIAELEAKLHKFETEEEKVEELEEVKEELEEVKEEEMESEEKKEEMETEEKEEEMEEEEKIVSLSQEDVEKIVEEKLAEKMDEMSEILADLKLKLEEVSKEEEEVERVELSSHEIRTQKALAFHKAFGNKW
jgi:hypothetical protein